MIMMERHRKEIWDQPGLSSVFYAKNKTVFLLDDGESMETALRMKNEEDFKHYKNVGYREMLVASKSANPGTIKSQCQ